MCCLWVDRQEIPQVLNGPSFTICTTKATLQISSCGFQARDAVKGLESTLELRINKCKGGRKPYPLSAETLEPLARFVRKLSKDPIFADEGFPGLEIREFIRSFSTNYSICST